MLLFIIKKCIMDTIKIKKITTIFSGLPVNIGRKGLSDRLLLWVKDMVSSESSCDTYIFAKVKLDNTVAFYTEEGLLLCEMKFEDRLPAEMYSDEILVGVINTDISYDEKSDIINLKARLVANPKESDKETAALFKFRSEMLQKFG